MEDGLIKGRKGNTEFPLPDPRFPIMILRSVLNQYLSLTPSLLFCWSYRRVYLMYGRDNLSL
jgi:hypothetical protein